jgi:hypothetical protein
MIDLAQYLVHDSLVVCQAIQLRLFQVIQVRHDVIECVLQFLELWEATMVRSLLEGLLSARLTPSAFPSLPTGA